MQNLRNKAYSLLRRSESFFKTDMVYLSKGGFWLLSGQVISLAISFGLSVAFANLLYQYEYGTYRYILSVAGMLGIISLSGLPTALTRSVAKGRSDSLWLAFFTNLKWSLLMTVGAGAIGLYYLLHGNNTLGISLLVAGALSPLLDSGELYNSFLNGTQQFKRSSIYRTLRTLFNSAGMLLALWFTRDPLYLVIVYFFLHTLSVTWIFFRVAREVPRTTIDNPEMIRLGVHTSFINGLASFADKIDNILVFQFLGPIQLAIYNFAVLLPTHMSGITKNIGTLATPRFAQMEKSSVQKTLVSKSLMIALVGGVLAVGYILIAPLLFNWFFPQYLDAIIYSQVYAVILVFSAALPVALLDVHLAIKEKYKANFLASFSKIILIFCGVFFYGLWGLIVARIISKVVSVYVAFFFSKRI
ncbi:MAG: oligosaccharide flippase family protein [Patescibacteria group bacterium]